MIVHIYTKVSSLETGYTYGRRRLQYQLNNEGHQIGIYRTTTLMKQANIKAIRPKKRHYYSDTRTLHQTANNLLNRDFNQSKSYTHWETFA